MIASKKIMISDLTFNEIYLFGSINTYSKKVMYMFFYYSEG